MTIAEKILAKTKNNPITTKIFKKEYDSARKELRDDMNFIFKKHL